MTPASGLQMVISGDEHETEADRSIDAGRKDTLRKDIEFFNMKAGAGDRSLSKNRYTMQVFTRQL